MDEVEKPESSVEQVDQTVPPVMPVQTVPPSMAEEFLQPHYQPTPANEDPMRFVVPMNPSVWAVIAGYVGMFSILAIPAPFAIIFGIVALNDLKKNPTKTGKGRAWFGITIGAFFVVFYIYVLFMTMNEPKKS